MVSSPFPRDRALGDFFFRILLPHVEQAEREGVPLGDIEQDVDEALVELVREALDTDDDVIK